VINEKNTVQCEKRTCPTKVSPTVERNLAAAPKYWIKHLGTCYEIQTQGFCETVEEKLYYSKDGKLECSFVPILASGVRVLGTNLSQLECAAGHKRSQTGQCTQVVSFE